MQRIARWIALLFVCSGALWAQTPPPAPQPSHLLAAVRLLESSGMERIMDESVESMLKAQLEQMPQMAPFENVMRQFLEKYMSWKSLKDEIAVLYCQSFTEQELQQLIEFYQTELGRKLVTRMPVLMNKGATLGQQRMQAHMSELQTAIQQRMTELQQKTPPASK